MTPVRCCGWYRYGRSGSQRAIWRTSFPVWSRPGALDLSAIYASCEEERGYEPAWSAPFPSLPVFLAHNCAQVLARLGVYGAQF